MNQYLLTIYQPDGDPPPPEFLAPIMANVEAWMDELKQADAWVFNGPLYPPEQASVLRVRGGDVMMTDGPYVEGKEHVGGLTVVRAEDLHGALDWGRKLARILDPLVIEVRQIHTGDG